MSAGGYLTVLASSMAAPVGYTLIKVAHLRKKQTSRNWLLYTGRFIVVVLYPVLLIVAYLYGERYLVPVSHAAAVIWHTVLAWFLLPEGFNYGWRAVGGALVFSFGVGLIIHTNAESSSDGDTGDWDRLAAWTISWQFIGLFALTMTTKTQRAWFLVCGMLKSNEILISAAAWNLVQTNYDDGWMLTALFAVPLLASGLSTVVLTDKLVELKEMCVIIPAQTAMFVFVGVLGDVFFYKRWEHWTAEESGYFACGLGAVMIGIYLFRE